MLHRNPIPYYFNFTKSFELNDLVEISVDCHSGYTSDEYPVCFHWDSIRFEITEILDRWYQGNLNPDVPPANYFKVRTNDNKVYIIKHMSDSDKWFLWIHGESINLF